MKIALRPLATLLLPLLFSGCNLPSWGGDSSTLAPISYHYVFAMRIYECTVEISPAGEAEVSQRTGNGPKDVLHATTQLTPDQRTALHAAFRDWKQLKGQYPDVDFTSPVSTISYDGYEVTSGSGKLTPASYKTAQALLDKIAQSALAAATQPATTKP